MVSASVIIHLLKAALMYFNSTILMPFFLQLKRKPDSVNQIAEFSELNTGVLQTPVSGKGGKAKKSSRSAKSNKSGILASGANAGEFWHECSAFRFYLPEQLLVSQ